MDLDYGVIWTYVYLKGNTIYCIVIKHIDS